MFPSAKHTYLRSNDSTTIFNFLQFILLYLKLDLLNDPIFNGSSISKEEHIDRLKSPLHSSM